MDSLGDSDGVSIGTVGGAQRPVDGHGEAPPPASVAPLGRRRDGHQRDRILINSPRCESGVGIGQRSRVKVNNNNNNNNNNRKHNNSGADRTVYSVW
ncbi:hypothetical protein EYF80_054708 [Liparis tanakae]|uniref:Uncharacterized protein n=1 Tax=Liparis tanakae TaxID=230148 RepID=A0A4Z2F1W3_9TELE|nr:hypothetical protein EYF80_054708 [Liparis tanakae]